MNDPIQKSPDEELQRLVAAYLDQSLDADEKARFETRLRQDADARKYCARRIYFDAELHEVLAPQEQLEWSETRRIVKSGPISWELRREQSLRFGPPIAEGLSQLRRKRVGWLAAALLTVAVAVGWFFLRPSSSRQLALRNPGFEDSDLTLSASSESTSLLEWQDFFGSKGASLIEISKYSSGKILAREGRNVARLKGFSYLTQRLTGRDGRPFLARPGDKIRLKGWAYVDKGQVPGRIQVSLRFVASGWPTMRQYKLGITDVVLNEAGWQPFSHTFELQSDLETTEGWTNNEVQALPSLDLKGRQITLSIDNVSGRGDESVLLLDDLMIEIQKN